MANKVVDPPKPRWLQKQHLIFNIFHLTCTTCTHFNFSVWKRFTKKQTKNHLNQNFGLELCEFVGRVTSFFKKESWRFHFASLLGEKKSKPTFKRWSWYNINIVFFGAVPITHSKKIIRNDCKRSKEITRCTLQNKYNNFVYSNWRMCFTKSAMIIW